MERVLKKVGSRESARSKSPAQRRLAPDGPQGDIASSINNSPVVLAQRERLQSLFGGAIRRQGAPDATQSPAVQKVDWGWWGNAARATAGYAAGAVGAVGGAVGGTVAGAYEGLTGSGEGLLGGAARGFVEGGRLGYQRPGAALGALAGGAAGSLAGPWGTALGTTAGFWAGDAVNEMLAPSLEPGGYENDEVDTDNADVENATPLDSRFDEEMQGVEMPLSDYVRQRERSLPYGDLTAQLAAPFGGVSTNSYKVGLTGKTHTVSYTRIGNGGINFNAPTSVTPAFGVPIQNTADKTNILFTYKGTEYIDIKPKGKYVYTWAKNKKARSVHFRAANLKRGYAGSGQPYSGWTWHHQVAPRGEMVPVLTDVHKRHNHNGGVFLW